MFCVPTSGFILDPPTIPDRCVTGERGSIASQLWVVGCNPLFETRVSCCFSASKVHKAAKSSEKCENRAVRPIFLCSTRIFSILLPSGMLVAPGNRGFAWIYAVSCAFPYLLRLCMPALPLIRRFRFERQGSTSTHDNTRWECSERELVHNQPVVGRSVATPCWTRGLCSGPEVS